MAVTIGRTAWTDDDGSGTTGTVINNAVKTELYNQIDTALAALMPIAGGILTGDLKFTDATYDIGKSGATRPRDLFLSRNAVIGGTLTLGGNVVSDLLFTDATYDIGKSGATRPRDGFFSRNVAIGGTLAVSGVQTNTVATGGVNSASFISSHATNPFGVYINYSAAAPNGTSNEFLSCSDSSTVRCNIRSNGGIANFSANNVNLSDAEVKNLFGSLTSQRGSFRRLNLVLAAYKDAPDQTPLPMLTAQDVEIVYPELVTDFGVGLKGVREHCLQIYALKVIQELDAAVLDHESRLALLEAKAA